MYSSHEYSRVMESIDEGSTSGSTYHSSISPRPVDLRRPRVGGGNSGVVTRLFQSFQSTGNNQSFGPGLASLVNFPGVPIRGPNNQATNTALVEINLTRQRDKRDLAQLNDKFAQYVEKVRFLEAQNRKLLIELEALKSRAGQGSSRIKEMYDIEMAEANKLIDATKRDAAAANMKFQQTEKDLNRLRARYNEVSSVVDTDRKNVETLQRQIAENEAQIALFRRRMSDLEEEAQRYKSHAQRILAEISRIQNDIQKERFQKTSSEVEKVALEDELQTSKARHEADLADIRARAVTSDLDPSKFFRNELAQAIREIRQDYENRTDSQRNDLQSRYMLLINELMILEQRPDPSSIQSEQQRRNEQRVRTEVTDGRNRNLHLRAQNEDLKNRIDALQQDLKRLRDDGAQAQTKMAKEIEDARRRLDQVNRDYQEVTNMKTSLEKEITTYRDLLESQNGLRGYVDRIVANVDQQNLNRTSTGAGSSFGNTSISQIVTMRQGPAYSVSGPSLSSLVGANVPDRTPMYQTLSSGFRSSAGDSVSSDNPNRRSEDY